MGAHGTNKQQAMCSTQRHLVASLGTPAGPWQHDCRKFLNLKHTSCNTCTCTYLHVLCFFCYIFSWWLCDVLWMCWSTFVRFSNYSLLSLSLSLFSGVALKRAFGFVGSACGHKSKREEMRKLHWTWERCCICLCTTFSINDYLLICMLWTWKITDVGCLIICLYNTFLMTLVVA